MSVHLEITQGLRVDDLPSLQDKVRLRGGRLIAYSEVISAILISARTCKVKGANRISLRGCIGFGILAACAMSLLIWQAST